MVWCVFRTSFLSKNKRDQTIPTVEDILTTGTFEYKFINVAWSAQAETKANEFLGELMTQHIPYFNEAFFYIYGCFSLENPKQFVYNYRDLINTTHNISLKGK